MAKSNMDYDLSGFDPKNRPQLEKYAYVLKFLQIIDCNKTINTMSKAVLEIGDTILEGAWFKNQKVIEAAFSTKDGDRMKGFEDAKFAMEFQMADILSISDGILSIAMRMEPDETVEFLKETPELAKAIIDKKFVESIKLIVELMIMDTPVEPADQKFRLRFLKKSYPVLGNASRQDNLKLLKTLLPGMPDKRIEATYAATDWYNMNHNRIREELHIGMITGKYDLSVDGLLARCQFCTVNRLLMLGFKSSKKDIYVILNANENRNIVKIDDSDSDSDDDDVTNFSPKALEMLRQIIPDLTDAEIKILEEDSHWLWHGHKMTENILSQMIKTNEFRDEVLNVSFLIMNEHYDLAGKFIKKGFDYLNRGISPDCYLDKSWYDTRKDDKTPFTFKEQVLIFKKLVEIGIDRDGLFYGFSEKFEDGFANMSDLVDLFKQDNDIFKYLDHEDVYLFYLNIYKHGEDDDVPAFDFDFITDDYKQELFKSVECVDDVLSRGVDMGCNGFPDLDGSFMIGYMCTLILDSVEESFKPVVVKKIYEAGFEHLDQCEFISKYK